MCRTEHWPCEAHITRLSLNSGATCLGIEVCMCFNHNSRFGKMAPKELAERRAKFRKLGRQCSMGAQQPAQDQALDGVGFQTQKELAHWDEEWATRLNHVEMHTAAALFENGVIGGTDFSGCDMAVDAFESSVNLVYKECRYRAKLLKLKR